jgi:hypothetical protein
MVHRAGKQKEEYLIFIRMVSLLPAYCAMNAKL